uniref:Uncharacterized protein n=1 Tax=Physcomitrium patens TaxID=3218 RepID=A0A2K1JR36_PHYPA|nr:hypothetical protein PHYPA_016381 [Physcomitrium patens]
MTASKTQGYSGRSRDLTSGKIYDDVEKVQGTNHDKELSNQLTKLNNTHFCQSGIVIANTFSSPQSSPLLNHEYLVLEVCYGPDMSEVFTYKKRRLRWTMREVQQQSTSPSSRNSRVLRIRRCSRHHAMQCLFK